MTAFLFSCCKDFSANRMEGPATGLKFHFSANRKNTPALVFPAARVAGSGQITIPVPKTEGTGFQGQG
jgi:hypothetical protein